MSKDIVDGIRDAISISHNDVRALAALEVRHEFLGRERDGLSNKCSRLQADLDQLQASHDAALVEIERLQAELEPPTAEPEIPRPSKQYAIAFVALGIAMEWFLSVVVRALQAL